MEQQSRKLKHSLKKANSKKKKVTFKETLAQSITITNNKVLNLLMLMQSKKSNLAVAADVTTKKELLELIEKVGPHICILKTHIDIIEDFDWELIEELKHLSNVYEFLILEDRKFADIGATVIKQCEGGIYKIAQWADFVTVHTIPGPGILEGLKQVAQRHNLGFILLPQMSSEGTLARDEYTVGSIEMAKKYKDYVIGFIAREKLTEDQNFLHFTPGVKLQEGGDDLGQQYLTPQKAIANGTDIIIVGRGIIKADDPEAMAQKYQKEAWKRYVLLK